MVFVYFSGVFGNGGKAELFVNDNPEGTLNNTVSSALQRAFYAHPDAAAPTLRVTMDGDDIEESRFEGQVVVMFVPK
jgi:hypothetical protein